ncbi:MAG TPA: NUDIX hydrolase, partial [Candidatus Saccharimonadales bacterium]
MKLNFSPQQDGRVHSHCVRCQAEAVVKRAQRYHCNQCGHVDDRAIIIDPEVTWWLQEGVYYHSTAGVFLRNPEGKLLFFERVKFPFGLTVPAGHVSPAESDQETALRETFEETTIRLRRDQLMPLFSEMIHQDSCPRGADSH